MQAIWSFSCSLAITRSSLFGLHLGRKTFQNSFYTWVAFYKMSNWNIKPHELLRKNVQSKAKPGPKKVKTCECSNKEKKRRAESDKCVRKTCFFLFFFLVYYIYVIVYWKHSRRGSLEKNIIGKVLLSREFPFCLLWKSGVLLFCWPVVYSVSLVLT